MREQFLTTCRWCTTGSAWCVTNVMTACQLHQTISATTANRTVYPPEREGLTSQFCQSNHQQGTGRINLSSYGNLNGGFWGNWFPIGCPIGDTPHPLAQPWRRSRWERHHPSTCDIPLLIFLHIMTRQLPATHKLCKTSASSVGLYKLKVTLEVGEIKS